MSALRKKRARDLWRMRYQVLTIAVVVGCGIGSFVAPLASVASVEASRDSFYAVSRFADVFVHLRRAPEAILSRIRDLPGVAAADGRIANDYRVEIPDAVEPVSARFVSLTWPEDARLARPIIVSGREVEHGRPDEIMVSDGFAEAWQLQPGARIAAVLEGRRATFRVVGIAVSPEFVFVPSPRTGLPDPRHFGAMWVDGDALAEETGMRGAFNDVAVQLAVGAGVPDTIDRIDAILEPYGGLGAIARADQPSAKLVDQKTVQLRKLARSLPLIFLGIAAFLLNVLLTRIVATQREQIATMKALGFRTSELLRHYLGFAIAICAIGAVLGTAIGIAGAKGIIGTYQQYFKFGTYLFRINPTAILGGVAIALVAGLAGTYLAVRRAVRVPPAEAMRPEAPPTYHRSRFERLYALFPPAARMVVRDVARRPGRLVLSAASIALATAIMLAGASYSDSIARLLHLQFDVSHRESISVAFDRTRPWRAVRDLGQVPGVTLAEGERVLPVRMRNGTRTKTTVIVGIDPASTLHQLLDRAQQPMRVPDGGVALSRVLADELAVHAGDMVDVEDLELGRRRLRVPVTAIVDDLLGVQGYASISALARLLGEAPSADTALLAVDPQDVDAVNARLDALPSAASIDQPMVQRELFRAEEGDVFEVLLGVLTVFAAAIAVGVIYNNARIALELRSRDLATLRILGFTRGELATVLLGEQALQVALGVGPGLWLGAAIGRVTLASVDRELLRIPLVIGAASYVGALCVILLAATASALIVRRRADRLDLVAVLKARD